MTDRSTSGRAQADNRSGQPGTSNAARTQYTARPTAGHKLPLLRVRARRLIDAASGRAMDTDMTRRLQAAAQGDPGDPATYPRLKHRAHADAVSAVCRHDAPAGFTDCGGGGVRLGRPTDDVLRHVFGVG